jgi:hypothetical protein
MKEKRTIIKEKKTKKTQQEHWGNEMRTEMPGCSPHWFSTVHLLTLKRKENTYTS